MKKGKRALYGGGFSLIRRSVVNLSSRLSVWAFPLLIRLVIKSGERLELSFVSQLANGQAFQLREYQRAAVEAFYEEGSESGGHGTIILPCGAGKTIVGLAAIVKQQVATLILTSNSTSVRQWKQGAIG